MPLLRIQVLSSQHLAHYLEACLKFSKLLYHSNKTKDQATSTMDRSPSAPSPFISFIRWLRLKNYQYEVTFSLYMLTPMEKLVFNTLLLSFFSMSVVAAYIYLPDHVTAIYSHIYYYWAGDRSLIAEYMRDSNSANLETLVKTTTGSATTVLRKAAEL